MRVWAQVYFYCVVGVVISSALIASPLKKQLQKRVKSYTTRPGMQRSESVEQFQGAMLGVPVDPGAEFDEMVEEIVAEVNRRRDGVELPSQEELRTQVRETLSRVGSDIELNISKMNLPNPEEVRKQIRETLIRRVSTLETAQKSAEEK